MEKYGDYWIKNLNPENIKRSLLGALKRSGKSRLNIMITTKTGIFPEECSATIIPSGGSFVEAETDCIINDGWLHLFLEWWENKTRYEVEGSVKISDLYELYVS